METEVAGKAVLVYSHELSAHKLSDEHPLKPIRYRHAFELIEASGVLDSGRAAVLPPRPATDAELERFHEREYLDAVRTVGTGEGAQSAPLFGFGPGDNPSYPGLFGANALSAGGTQVAADAVVEGGASAAFSIAGGLHHALPRRASGFCVFNDPVVAIKGLVQKGLRVVYVDIDCHHGDGVQLGFYDTDRVLTISLHESGEFLFPGTGATRETGTGKGEGFSVNVPLAPYTNDAVYLEAFNAIVPPLIRAFRPDVLFTQLGIDTYFRDPITHMNLTTQGFRLTVERLAALAADVGCGWIAAGGGGYDLTAVARGWTMAFAVMAGVELPPRVPRSFTALPGLATFADPDPPALESDLESGIRRYAERSVEQIRGAIFPRFDISP